MVATEIYLEIHTVTLLWHRFNLTLYLHHQTWYLSHLGNLLLVFLKKNVRRRELCRLLFFLRAATFEASISAVAKTARPILLEIPKCFWHGVNMFSEKKNSKALFWENLHYLLCFSMICRRHRYQEKITWNTPIIKRKGELGVTLRDCGKPFFLVLFILYSKKNLNHITNLKKALF